MIERPSYMTDQEWQDYRRDHEPNNWKAKCSANGAKLPGNFQKCQLKSALSF